MQKLDERNEKAVARGELVHPAPDLKLLNKDPEKKQLEGDLLDLRETVYAITKNPQVWKADALEVSCMSCLYAENQVAAPCVLETGAGQGRFAAGARD